MKKLLFLLIAACSICSAKGSLELLISPDEIAGKLKDVAQRIDAEYDGEELTVVVVMKGALCVSADLIRNLQVPCKIEYLKASSYGHRGTSRGELRITGLDGIDLEGKNVLVVDDIFDSGHTMSGLISHLQAKNPKSLKSLVLLEKNIPREIEYRPDYTLFAIENRFVVGYGLDYKEYYRGLPGIYAFVNDVPFIASAAQ